MRRALGLGLLALAVVALVVAPLGAVLLPVLSAPTTAPPAADAVFVHAGAGGRLGAAEQLAEDGLAPTLVLSRGEYERWPVQDPDPLCEEPRTYEVVCVRPEPSTTVGEARAVADLVAERGWQVLVVVTSADHVARARTLLRQCTDAEVQMVAVPRSTGAAAIAHEALGLVAAVTVARAC